MLGVFALGAVCELEDLNAPLRQPELDALGHVVPGDLEKESLVRLKRLESLTGNSSFTSRDMLLSPDLMSKQRQRLVDSDRPHFQLEEYADLSDGRRVMLKDDRGWSSWPPNGFGSMWRTAVGRALIRDAIWVLGPDEVDTNDVWEDWVIEGLRSSGLEVDPASVHAAPFVVEFGPRVQHELRQPKTEVESIPDTEESLVDVVSFGAVCELDYLTDPVHSSAKGGGYAFCEQPYHVDWSDRKLLSQRGEMTAWGMREFHAQEFADLSNGRRVVLRDDHRWDFWPVNEPDSMWKFANGRELTVQVVSMLEPDDHDEWLDWMLRRLDGEGVKADPASAHAAPFRVEFGANVQHELKQRKPAG